MVICGDKSYQLNNPLKRNHSFGTRFLLGSLQHNVLNRNVSYWFYVFIPMEKEMFN